MKLITSKGQLVIPADFSFEMKKTNPFFSDEGEQSLPVTIPPSADNIRTLGNPDRLGGSFANLRKTDARVECGIFHRSGKLIIESIGSDGITASLALSESDLYTKSKDKSIRDIFADTYITRTGCTDAQSWMLYLAAVSAGTYSDDFICMPAYVEKQSGDSSDTVVILNEPDVDNMEDWGDSFILMRWRNRYIQIGSESEAVPDGYGITPFLYLHSFIRLLFEKLGYTVTANPFSSNAYSNIVLLNRNADTICKGTLCLGSIVPSCTVAEFIDFLENKFHVTALVDTAGKKVAIVSMESILTSSASMDMSGRVDGQPKITVSEEAHVVLSSDTSSIDGVEPPEETLLEYQKKYPILTEMNETEFAQALSESAYSVIKRKATGEFYIRKYNKSGGEEGETTLAAIGSDMFKYDREDTDTAEEYKSDDVVPAMMFYQGTSNQSRTFTMLAPYLGDRRHSTTSIKGKEDDGDEQEIMLAFAGPIVSRTAAGSPNRTFRYAIATTHRYNDAGVAWGTWDLTPEDIYTKFWAGYNKYLLNNNITVEMTADLSPSELSGLKMSDIVLYEGTRLIPEEINYDVGKSIVAGSGKYMVLKDGSVNPGTVPSFVAQLYKWEFCSNLAEVAAATAAEEAGTLVSSEFTETDTDAYEFIPPPKSASETTSVFTRTGRIGVLHSGSNGGAVSYYTKSINCWYKSVTI